MKSGLSVWMTLAVAGVVACALPAEAATITVLNDTGDVDVLTPTLHSRVSLTNLYGTSPVVPAITQTSATTYEIDFAPTAAFNASAYAQPAGQVTTVDGSLDIIVTFPSPVPLITDIFEDGVYVKSGTGAVNASGGVTVWAVDPSTYAKLSGPLGNAFGNATYNSNGTWVLTDQVSGFTGSYYAYMIHVDNILVAQATLPTPDAQGTAWIAKKDFTLVFTTPEPASLGVLALGALALLARRRRA
jgi:hypothetical protein